MCIEFDKDKLIAEVADVPGLRAETVQYRTIKALREQPVAESDLPFLKRHAFRDEKEFRLFVGRKTRDTPLLRVPVDRSAVRRVTLSPWLPASVCDQVKSCSRPSRVAPSCACTAPRWSRTRNGNAWPGHAARRYADQPSWTARRCGVLS